MALTLTKCDGALNACGSRISLIDWTRGAAMYTIMYSMRQNKTTCILVRIVCMIGWS